MEGLRRCAVHAVSLGEPHVSEGVSMLAQPSNQDGLAASEGRRAKANNLMRYEKRWEQTKGKKSDDLPEKNPETSSGKVREGGGERGGRRRRGGGGGGCGVEWERV